MQTRRKLLLFGLLYMFVLRETRLLIELLKKLSTHTHTNNNNLQMSFSDLNPLTAKKKLYKVLQKEWDETVLVSNKFHDILPKLSDKLIYFCYTWRWTLF